MRDSAATRTLLALFEHGRCSAVVDGFGREHGDSCVPMLGVVQGKKVLQKPIAASCPGKRSGKAGWYFSVLNWASE